MLMPVKIYFSYVHEDETLLNRLKLHLRPLQMQGIIDIWDDPDISAGGDWEREIKEQFDAAQVIFLLVSPDFMASDYCYSVEMPRAMRRYEQKVARVIPIILSRCDWKDAPFSKLLAIPKNAKPITEWEDREAAFDNIVTNIRRVVEELMYTGGETVLSQHTTGVEIYLSYAHQDESMMTEIVAHLRMLMLQGMIDIWHDGLITAGREWAREIDMHLNTAQIILLLISQNYLNSDYCYHHDMPRAMRRYEQKVARVIPIILSRCDWKDAPFSKLLAIPKNAKPITEWEDREAAFDNIVTNIRGVVEELHLMQDTNQLLAAKASLTIDLSKKELQPEKQKELERIEQDLKSVFEKRVSLAIEQEKERISKSIKDTETTLAETQEREHRLIQQKEQVVKAQQETEEKVTKGRDQIQESNRGADIYAAIAAIMSGFTLIATFEFCIRWLQWNWLLSHPNSYGLQVGFDVLLMITSFFLFGAIRVYQRKRRLSMEELGVLITLLAIVIAVVVGTFQLLGGPPAPSK